MAIVEVHCIANAKNTTSAIAPPSVRSCRSAACNPSDCVAGSAPYSVPSVPTITSRAITDVSSPIPIFQLNPSGRINGSISSPSRPIRLCARSAWNGMWLRNQSTIVTSRITVPACFRNTLPRSISRRLSERTVGSRYCGSSRMKGADDAFRIEDFSSHAVARAATNPSTYSDSITAARSPKRSPSSGLFGMNAAIISM